MPQLEPIDNHTGASDAGDSSAPPPPQENDPNVTISDNPVIPHGKRLLLALDLDQTLIHSCADVTEPGRIYGGIPIKYDFFIRRVSGRTADELPDDQIPPPLIFRDASECPPLHMHAVPGMKYKERYVWMRPFLQKFLETVSEVFDIVVYTASTRRHADPIIDAVDPKRLIRRRYYREYCDFRDGVDPATLPFGVFPPGLQLRGYRKFLDRLSPERYPHRTVLLDNSPISFEEIKENAIHIDDYFGNDPHDRKLLNVLPYLMSLANAHDARQNILAARTPDGARRTATPSFSYIPIDSPLVTPSQHIRKQIFDSLSMSNSGSAQQAHQQQMATGTGANGAMEHNMPSGNPPVKSISTGQLSALDTDGQNLNGRSQTRSPGRDRPISRRQQISKGFSAVANAFSRKRRMGPNQQQAPIHTGQPNSVSSPAVVDQQGNALKGSSRSVSPVDHKLLQSSSTRHVADTSGNIESDAGRQQMFIAQTCD